MASSKFTFPPPPPPPPLSTAANSFTKQPAHWDSAPTRGGRGWGRARGSGDRSGHGSHGRDHGKSRGGSSHGTNTMRTSSLSSSEHFTAPRQQPNFGNRHEQSSSLRKRPYDQVFEHAQQKAAVPTAPPPVPSFESDFKAGALSKASPPPQSKWTPSSDAPNSRQNLLGLTPSTDEREHGNEDEDEEMHLSAKVENSGARGIQFMHKGQLSSLNTPEEVAAWVAERKKRFYTKARAQEAATKAKIEAEEKARRKAAGVEKRLAPYKRHKHVNGIKDSISTGGVKARPFAEVLPKHFEKAGKEGQMPQTPMERVNSPILASIEHMQIDLRENETDAGERGTGPTTGGDGQVLLASSAALGPSPPEEGTDEGTSSSGSDSSDDADQDERPTEVSSKTRATRKVPPTPRQRAEKQTCRDFARTGHCKRGRRCCFGHESKVATSAAASSRVGVPLTVKTLCQRLREQQQELSNELVLQYVLYLGDNGYLGG